MRFNLFNIPVYIHPSFWIFVIFFTSIYQSPSVYSLILGGVLILSLLVHEFGHALTARFYGAQPNIVLQAFGGRAEYKDRAMTSKQAFYVTLNGPLLESLLIPLSYLILKSGIFSGYCYIQYFFYATMRINIIWCLLNLIPIAPLDGAHLLNYFLEKKFRSRGTQATLFVGLICVASIAPYLLFKGFFFFGIMLIIFGYQNFNALKRLRASTGENNPFKVYLQGVEALNNKDTAAAKKLLKKLLKSKDSKIRALSTQSLAEAFYIEGSKQTAYDMLINTNPSDLKDGKYLLCKLAFEKKNYDLIANYSRDIYENNPSFEVAILNSKAFAHLGQADLSFGWLETASLFGEKHKQEVQKIVSNPDYETIKNGPFFEQFMEKIYHANSKN